MPFFSHGQAWQFEFMHETKTRIALNREGVLFLCFVLGLGAFAIYSGNHSSLLFFCCLVAVWLILAFIAHRNFVQPLCIERRFVEEIFAGKDTRIDVLVTNRGTAPIYGLHIFEQFEDGSVIGPMFVHRLGPGETATARYVCVFPKRGQMKFGGFQLRSRFPLPFWEMRRHVSSETIGFVYPEPVSGMDQIVFQTSCSDGGPRRAHASETVIRELIHGHRAGRILWKLSAKRRSWLESVPLRTRSSETVPVIRVVGKEQLGEERFELQISQVTAYVLTQLQYHRTGEVHLGHKPFQYGRLPQQRRELLEILATIE